MSASAYLTYEPVPLLAPASVDGDAAQVIAQVIDLPPPRENAGAPLMTALSRRASTRTFSGEPLALTTLSELLWAADGVNRPKTGGRTAPSAHALNEVDVYAALPQGVYRYEPLSHRLLLKHQVDARNMTGYQDFVGTAPLDLVYVVRTSVLLDAPRQERGTFAAVAIGAMAQNVSLYCASEGLATVVRGWINHRILGDALHLNEDELPVLAQTVGKPV